MNDIFNEHKLRGSHDLSLPQWGPYSKKYFGISHLADAGRGFRFDVSLIPGLYRRDVLIPDVLKESGYTPWEVSADLEYYAYRQQIIYRDKIYSQVSFSRISDEFRLIRCETFNCTETPVSMAFHLLSMLEFPGASPYEVVLPPGAEWVDAVDNSSLKFATPRHDDALVWDGLRRGEMFDAGTVGGYCIGKDFGLERGDAICFKISPTAAGSITLRYMLPDGETLTFDLSGAAEGTIQLHGSGKYESVVIYTGSLSDTELWLMSNGGAAIRLDGIAVSAAEDANKIIFRNCDWSNEPIHEPGPMENSVLVGFKDIAHKYLLWWDDASGVSRKYQVESVRDTLLYNDAVHQHFMRNINNGDKERCTDITVQPVTLLPGGSRVNYFVVGSGSAETFAGLDLSTAALEEIYCRGAASAYRPATTESGEKYLFSQQLMNAVVMSNVVYPVYTRRSFIRHHTPGRCWNSLYTWDSGFIGLGLLEIDLERAIENLNAYVTEPGDAEAAFIHHGSPVPVQHYLLLELWNRTQDKNLLSYFYPRLRQYYNFLAGHAPGSSTGELKSGLLKTWEYFYNSGGWDDYPPQLELHHGCRQELEKVTPVISSAMAIRVAKILCRAARELDFDADIPGYEQDINTLSSALNKYSWDVDAGYYSYVRHDENGDALEFYRHSSGANYNMGMDGISPLIAGICTEEQKQLMFERLASEKHFMTPTGLSTVDLSAPYYRRDGYWNGSVWMPHQWFYWKTALNEGRGELAWKIANTALEIWRREVADSYYCFEHFTIESGRGGGWHHFGGLSAPILSWFGAYYCPGRLSGGFDLWVESENHADGAYEYHLSIGGTAGAKSTVLLVTGGTDAFNATYSGGELTSRRGGAGVLEITLPQDSTGVLKVFADSEGI
ncbi:MAG: hypothetical protein JXR78_07405 [Victivallales bacterium]|nr:hypothetical protein [Victivallales bacterium]